MSSIPDLRKRFDYELTNILSFWEQYTPDNQYGGFAGKIDHHNVVHESAPKGAVLNARILWSFSAAYLYSNNKAYLDIAKRAYNYMFSHFYDKEFGGVYWTVDYEGRPLDTKKQIYALAFAVYGLSEFYRATADHQALGLALKLYHNIENRSFDPENGGYMEAFTRDWQEIDDLRLSTKDRNEKKSMNTHLHILEAYTNLFRIWPDDQLRVRISALLTVFEQHIIDAKTKHLILFMDEKWIAKTDTVSYGHDIEASWLLLEAAETIQNESWIKKYKLLAVQMADAASRGIEADGSMIYEYEPSGNRRNREKHWWVQAEAMVGFLNAWQLTGEQKYYDFFASCWSFTENRIIDSEKGEWIWGLRADNSLIDHEDKVGLWKCPYHNSRACLEIIRRLKVKAG